ncbi:MAG TPA: zf-HC2 domain-containing protein [Myxococcaceae bacterium]|nr:zf-HC2 domain-containing protein [Myxococcaceae bacterium]
MTSTAPPDPHAALDRFVDGELPPGEAEAFRQHLAGCDRCQASLHARVQLAGLAQDALAGGAAPGATVIRPARWRIRAAAAVGVALAAGLAVVIAGRLPGGEPDPSLWLADRPARPYEARLSTPAADRYRPYEVTRGAETAPAPPLPALAKLEDRGRLVAIADAYLARGAPEPARPYLDRAGNTPEALASRAAMDLMLGRPEEAVRHAGQSLAAKPGYRPAQWNLALGLRALGLTVGAARQLDAVAAAGEPGWSDEAKQLVEQLRADAQRRKDHWAEVLEACLGAEAGELPFPADLQGVPLVFLRESFDETLARAGTAERLRELLPAAETLDERLGGDSARRAVKRALAEPMKGREAIGRAYAEKDHPDFVALADMAQKAGLRDLELWALLRAPVGQVSPERLVALAAAFGDPWYAAQAEERTATGASGLALLEDRVKACTGAAGSRFEMRCLAAERELVAHPLAAPADALAVGRRALERARREGDMHMELSLLKLMARVAKPGDPALSDAYDMEHDLLMSRITP